MTAAPARTAASCGCRRDADGLAERCTEHASAAGRCRGPLAIATTREARLFYAPAARVG